MKKVIEVIFVLLLVLFSFYYTEKAIVLLEINDPIMKKIKDKGSVKEEEAINAKVEGDYLIPGYNGLAIDLNNSFTKMKGYGSYNDALLVFEEVKPTISIDDYYDKYISSGNGISTNIALVFTIDNNSYTNNLLNILKEMNIVGTFFIDGKYTDSNISFATDAVINGNEIEVLNYDNSYDELLFKASIDKIKTLTSTTPKYCYATYDNEEVLNLCSKLSMHTIIPTLKLDNNIYSNAKGNLRSGSIISIEPTKFNISELKVLINYIKQRGFTLVTLDTLLNEARNEK